MGRKPSIQEHENLADPDIEDPEEEEDTDENSSGSDDLDSDSDSSEITAEFNVDDLLAQIETAQKSGSRSELSTARRRLEDYLEQRRIARELMDFSDYDLED